MRGIKDEIGVDRLQGDVYLNGAFVPYEEARLPIEDRGTVFADGVYEVIRFYGGNPLAMRPHMERLQRSAEAIRLPQIDLDELTQKGLELVARNGIGDGTLYVQVTRGVAPRNHAFPPPETPMTCFMMARELPRPDKAQLEEGVACITVPDIRWARCDIKSIALLPNVLAKQEARDKGAYEALFVRDGIITEGSSSNAFAVKEGKLLTHPQGSNILPGITRRLVVSFAQAKGVPIVEEALTVDALAEVDELFVCSTTAELTPVVQVDGRPVGDGQVGPVTRRLQEAYEELIEGVRAGTATGE